MCGCPVLLVRQGSVGILLAGYAADSTPARPRWLCRQCRMRQISNPVKTAAAQKWALCVRRPGSTSALPLHRTVPARTQSRLTRAQRLVVPA